MITTQQFWKGLGMALISVIIAYISVTPINIPLLAVTAVCTILSYFGKNLVPWLHSDSPPSSLSLINVLSGVLLALATAFTESIGTYLIEGKILWVVVLKVTVYTTGTYLLSTFFAPPYSIEKKRLFASKGYINKYMKGAAVIVLLLCLSTGVSAQKGVAVLGHVSKKTIEKGLLNNGSFLLSFDAVIEGPTYVFDGPDTQFKVVKGYGIAAGYKHILPDLTSDYGVSIGVIHKVITGEGEKKRIGVAILPNYYNFMAGPVWFVGDRYPGVMVGGSLTF